MKRTRILLADDHKIVLEGLKRLLEPEFDLVGTVEDGRALVSQAEQLRPDVIVVDISMPLLNGIEAICQIKKIDPSVKVVFLTMHPDVTYAIRAFEAGAAGYVLKHSASTELLTAIREALQGRTYVTPIIAGELLQSYQIGTHRQQDKTQTVDEPPAGNPAVICGGSFSKGNCADPEHFPPHGGISQVQPDRLVESEELRGAHPVRHQAWHH